MLLARVPAAAVLVFFQPEGIDGDACRAAARRTLQRAIAGGVVGVPGLVRAGNLPLHHLIQRVVGKRRRLPAIDTTDRAAGGVAPLVVAQAVSGAAGQVATTVALPKRHDVGHLMRLPAIAVEVQELRATAVQRDLSTVVPGACR